MADSRSGTAGSLVAVVASRIALVTPAGGTEGLTFRAGVGLLSCRKVSKGVSGTSA